MSSYPRRCERLVDENAISQGRHEYRVDKTIAAYAFVTAAFFGFIGVMVGESHGVLAALFAVGLAVYGMVVCIDNQVKLRIDAFGITKHGLCTTHVGWTDVVSWTVVEKTRTASIRHYLRLRTNVGEQVDFELSRLNSPASTILNAIARQFEIRRAIRLAQILSSRNDPEPT